MATAKKKTKEKVIATVTGDLPLNVRQDPSKNNPPVGTLDPGAEVAVLEVGEEWCKIKGGYVMRQFLTF